MDYKIVDNDGVWVSNACPMTMADGSTKLRYEPGVALKVKPTNWVKTQLAAKVLKEVDGPEAKPEPENGGETGGEKPSGKDVTAKPAKKDAGQSGTEQKTAPKA